MSNTPSNVIPDRKKLPFGGAHAVESAYSNTAVNRYIQNTVSKMAMVDTNIQDYFLMLYRQWILTSELNTVQGLELFPVSAYSNGTSEAFDKFYLKHHTRRFRCFRGEYMYHQAAWRNYFPDWKFIEDDNLDSNDAVVISLPFSDLGREHPQMRSTLDQCASLNIPVLLDCAYFGICQDLVFDFTHPAITDITFSLSKFLPVAHLRIGMRLTKLDDDDSLLVLNKTLYTNRIGISVGIDILNAFEPDSICKKYRATQEKLCRQLNVEPSNCVIFGLDHNHQFDVYNRGLDSNRLNLAKYLEKGILPENFQIGLTPPK